MNKDKSELSKKLSECQQHLSWYKNLFVNMLHEVHVWELVRDESGKIRTWRLIDANPEALNSWGVKLSQVVGKTTEDIFNDPSAPNLFMPIVEKIFSENKPYKWEQFFEPTNQTLEMISIPVDDYFISTGLDITERKKSEELIRVSEEKYRTLSELLDLTLSNISDPVFLTDDKGEFTFICPNVEIALGYSVDEVKTLGNISKILGENLFSPDDLEEKSEISNIECEVKDQSGKILTFLLTVKKVQIKTGTRLYFMRDISERKEAAKVRERLYNQLDVKTKNLEEVINVISHDLRFPLASIDGFSSLLEDNCNELTEILKKELPNLFKNEDPVEIIDQCKISAVYINQSTRKMEVLLEGLLKIARLGRSEVNLEKLDINNLLEDLIIDFKLKIEEIGAKINISRLDECYGDALQVAQIFTNLIGNALKYSDPYRQCYIMISSYREGLDSVFCVEDNGIGISEDDKEKIFQIYSQVDKNSEGDGLGLTIVQKIIEGHSGKIWLESQLGKGSKFCFTLPNSLI